MNPRPPALGCWVTGKLSGRCPRPLQCHRSVVSRGAQQVLCTGAAVPGLLIHLLSIDRGLGSRGDRCGVRGHGLCACAKTASPLVSEGVHSAVLSVAQAEGGVPRGPFLWLEGVDGSRLARLEAQSVINPSTGP